MAAAAARSASSSSPRPRTSAAAIAARSVTRMICSVSTRSIAVSASCGMPPPLAAQRVSIRIICGRPKISPSASMLASALRTACSVVECVMIVTG